MRRFRKCKYVHTKGAVMDKKEEEDAELDAMLVLWYCLEKEDEENAGEDRKKELEDICI